MLCFARFILTISFAYGLSQCVHLFQRLHLRSYLQNFLNCFCKLMVKYVKHNLSEKILEVEIP